MPNENHYPAGAPQGKGGQFAPKNVSGAVETEEKAQENKAETPKFNGNLTLDELYNVLMSLKNENSKEKTKKLDYGIEQDEILQKANEEFTRRLGEEKSQVVIENIKDADPKYLKTLINFWQKHPEVGFKIGPRLDTSYNWNPIFVLANVEINTGVYTDKDWYAKGSSIFHESAHAINDTVGRNGEHKLWTETHVSAKYNMTLAEMVKKEIQSCDYQALQNEYLTQKTQAMQNDIEYQRLASLEKQKKTAIISSRTTLNQVGQETDNPQFFEALVKRYFDAEHDFEIVRRQYKSGNTYSYYKMIYDKAYQKMENYAQDYPKLYAILKYYESAKDDFRIAQANRRNYIQDAIEPALGVIYGDLSDMLVASLGNKAKINMGHSEKYFRDDYTRRGDEAFAEIMSAKATNPQSYEILQRVIPKTIEIFEEIIERIERER